MLNTRTQKTEPQENTVFMYNWMRKQPENEWLNLENAVPSRPRAAKCGTRTRVHSAMLQPDSLRR